MLVRPREYATARHPLRYERRGIFADFRIRRGPPPWDLFRARRHAALEHERAHAASTSAVRFEGDQRHSRDVMSGFPVAARVWSGDGGRQLPVLVQFAGIARATSGPSQGQNSDDRHITLCHFAATHGYLHQAVATQKSRGGCASVGALAVLGEGLVILTINVAVLLAVVVYFRLRRRTQARSRVEERNTALIVLVLGILIAPTPVGQGIADFLKQLVQSVTQSSQ